MKLKERSVIGKKATDLADLGCWHDELVFRSVGAGVGLDQVALLGTSGSAGRGLDCL